MAENTPGNPASGDTSRRKVLGIGLRVLGAAALGGSVGAAMLRKQKDGSWSLGSEPKTLWQIDPMKCTQCGKCATECVVEPSAVKCQHQHMMCGYCLKCFGYFDQTRNQFTERSENETCPTDALVRKHIEGEYYEYTVIKDLCIGCAKCVKTCGQFGNRSLYLQIDHTICVNCNQCAIARVCPADAFVRVPQSSPYITKTKVRD